ncbi:hypothetical protein V7266_07510 [Neobacillus drentensis]|uniref:hypothetical protein n=1 Tax=Neobacillus drentensis TaxID=220684 RepID=UPI002FFEFB7A
MALKVMDTPLVPFILRKGGLFTYDEVLQVRDGYGFSSKSTHISAFKTLFKYFETKEIETPTQAWLLYENEQKQVDKEVDVFLTLHPFASNHKVFETYLIMLMACSRIPKDRDFISDLFIHDNNQWKNHGIIKALMEDYYNLTKPDGFPKLDELINTTNRKFLFSLNAFYKINDLTEETIVKEFLNAVSADTHRKTGVFKRKNPYHKHDILEFIDKIYPVLVKIGAKEHKDNIFHFLRSLIFPLKN